MSIRINKLLSNLGYCSRRDANRWIELGRLTVNGQSCKLGQWLEPDDIVLLDGKALEQQQKVYIALNKPVGITCTAESDVKDNIIDYIQFPQYIFPVGRLDKESQGLILLTNDGELANQILHAEHEHEKAYHVTVNRPFDAAFIEKMSSGVEVDGIMTRPCTLKQLAPCEFEIVLSQGLNRQIRKMCRSLGYKVLKLERIRIMNILLGTLEYGAWRHLTELELLDLRAQL